ncbi:MAG: flavodoxin-dependent (E)-4-hydroxy-3-methylbut-2-enyl-diphosphate synthase, partial [Oscillospiraceae bacterium]|nr:flavodoxin-dependent (E)-4-hydroxy-3-methylbut-2-enyl-diphosphate synthase [Oscillospiraceae bacterium]
MRNIRKVKVGNCVLGSEKIYIQSMLNKRSDDIEGSVQQSVELEKAGCDIVRAAIPDMDAVKLIP